MFSEPGAGSDVARLQTRAELDGDEWILNGQKVWTSGAQYCDYGIMLGPHRSREPKHEGISMFIVDMRAPGVEIRPIRQITAAPTSTRCSSPTCESPPTGSWASSTAAGASRSRC